MVKNQNNLAEEVLEHHGILGMHWGIRRYQPYPSDYSGDGKFMGKRHERKLAKIEKKKARHQAKIDTKIKNAVEDGNKKALKKLKDEIEPAEYEKKYEETVQNGIDNAVKDRDKSALKKYKEDLTPREYKHEKDRIDFKQAIDEDNSRKTKKLLSKVDPEDVKEATDLIRSRVALQDQKLSKIRQDSELMARLDKMNSGLSKVSKTASSVASIGKSFGDVSKTMAEFSKTQKEAEDKKKEKEIDKIIRSGNLDKIRANEHRMNAKELSEAYDKIVQIGSEEDIKKAAPYMNNKQVTAAVQKLSQLEKLGSSSDTTVEEAKNSSAVQVVTDWINTSFDDMNLGGASVGNLRDSFTRYEWGNTGSRVGQYGFGHSDDFTFEDVLMHHGILGMHWGIRRFQPYPKGYSGDGKEVGQAKRVSLGDRKYQNYDVSFAKTGSAVRKKTKYTNIDGSLNEKGKLHAQKYISKQIDKNEKYYAKEIAKYEKKAEKYKDSNPEMSQKFKDMIKDAEKSRDHVNSSIKEMAIDEIMTNEAEDRQKAMKAIRTAAGVTVGAATGGAVLAGGLGLSSALSKSENFENAKKNAKFELENAKAQFDLSDPVDSVYRMTQTSPIAAKAEQVVENTIRTYSDARAYVLGIGLDQAGTRLKWANEKYGIADKYGEIIGSAGSTALNNMGFTPETINQMNTLVNTTGNTTNAILNNPNTMKIIQAGGSTVTQALSDPATMNALNELNNAMGQTSNIPTPVVTVPPVTQSTLGTKAALDEYVASSATSTPRVGNPNNHHNSTTPVSQQRKRVG